MKEGLRSQGEDKRGEQHININNMSRTSKLFNTAANAIQMMTPELQQGAQPTFRHWATGALRAYPAKLEAEMSGAGRLRDFSKWTPQDRTNALKLAGNFAVFFCLGEALARGM